MSETNTTTETVTPRHYCLECGVEYSHEEWKKNYHFSSGYCTEFRCEECEENYRDWYMEHNPEWG
jgi:hypothetical protein